MSRLSEYTNWWDTLWKKLGEFVATLAASGAIVWLALTLSDGAPVHYFGAKEATVTSSGQCHDGGGHTSPPASCHVSWRFADGTAGDGRIDAKPGEVPEGSTVHVAGDQGYASEGDLVLAALLFGIPVAMMLLWTLVLFPMAAVRDILRARRRSAVRFPG
ncbi:hypothetical protein [Streptomyces sp. MP131-18]|uniref:hypothetical protein n=1 Tax=Streptomyces sp. MP131-18 TaxID=1857892 RepID=UPI0009CD7556|nr:hypothetical protein [Streptomyces sp. MP131-18]ONK11306.1 hypothetical protein STBA_20370 [Streptomyces sp. MP131-18]